MKIKWVQWVENYMKQYLTKIVWKYVQSKAEREKRIYGTNIVLDPGLQALYYGGKW